MRIIENNSKQEPEWPKMVICPNCLSVLEIDKSDIKKVWVNMIRNEDIYRDGYDCPCCNNTSELKKTNI